MPYTGKNPEGVGMKLFVFLARSALFLAICLGGCKHKVQPPVAPAYLPKQFPLNVKNITIIDETSFKATNDSNALFPQTLSSQLQAWARSAFVGKGSTGSALVRILDGRITMETPAHDKNKRDMQANVIVSLEFVGPSASSQAKITVRSTCQREFTILGWSAERQESLYKEVWQQLAIDLDQEFSQQLGNLGPVATLIGKEG